MTKLKERYLINAKGQREAVVLDILSYQELLDDLEDLYLIAERKKEPTFSLSEAKRRLRKSGRL